ncbi:hypothetical protein KJ845_01275 [Patescibacteria group bacterium]|nr:hypothetical protein [Patescibacteria group bacterium]
MNNPQNQFSPPPTFTRPSFATAKVRRARHSRAGGNLYRFRVRHGMTRTVPATSSPRHSGDESARTPESIPLGGEGAENSSRTPKKKTVLDYP